MHKKDQRDYQFFVVLLITGFLSYWPSPAHLPFLFSLAFMTIGVAGLAALMVKYCFGWLWIDAFSAAMTIGVTLAALMIAWHGSQAVCQSTTYCLPSSIQNEPSPPNNE